MISLFFGEFYRLTAARRAVCVLAGFALSFLFNMARTTLLTWVAAREGVPAIARWHDTAGITILVACFLTLWLLPVWLRGKGGQHSGQKPEVGSQRFPLPSPIFHPSTVRRLAIALLAWFVLVEAGVEFRYRAHERVATANNPWTISAAGLGSNFVKVEIPPDIRSQFRSDESMQGHWRDESGNVWQLYYFRWFPAKTLDQRVAIQLAKTHGPEICLPAVGMTMKADLGIITVPIGDRQFAFRQYMFQSGDQPLHVFYAIYEDPTGSAVLANRRKNTVKRIAAALAGIRSDGQVFLEMAAYGPENPEEARAVFARQLDKMVKMDKP